MRCYLAEATSQEGRAYEKRVASAVRSALAMPGEPAGRRDLLVHRSAEGLLMAVRGQTFMIEHTRCTGDEARGDCP